MSAGEGYGLALAGGRVYSFGKNERGQLGDGAVSSAAAPAPIAGIAAVSAIAAGGAHALVLLAPGVQPPAPVLSVEPGTGSLMLAWTLHDEGYIVEYRQLSGTEPERCEAGGGSWVDAALNATREGAACYGRLLQPETSATWDQLAINASLRRAPAAGLCRGTVWSH